MDDSRIVQLYFARNEDAIALSRSKYGKMLYGIALGILRSREDAEETESDTYLTAWNKIPPDAPPLLGAYLSKITRYLSLNRKRKEESGKRPRISALESELLECLPDIDTPERALESELLRENLNSFLKGLKEEERVLFLRRYFYGEDIAGIAARTGFSESKVKTTLCRTREKLRKHLEKEGLL